MTTAVNTFVQNVRIALDQNMSSQALASIGDVDTLSLDELITSKIEDAADAVIRSAPIDFLSDISIPLTSSVTIKSIPRLYAELSLPTDFLRLVSFKMTGWPYAVNEATVPDNDMLVKLNSPYGVYGTKERPVVVISPSNPLKLEVFSPAEIDSVLDNCKYAKKPVITNDNIELGERLERPTVYYAAYLTATSLGASDIAEKLLAVCKEMLNLI